MALAVTHPLAALRSEPVRRVLFVGAIAGSAALAVGVSGAAPTGIELVDSVYVGGFAATVAYLAGTARRWTWFVPPGVAAPLAADGLAAGCAAASIVIGLWSVVRGTRSRSRAAVVAGLGVAALLRTEPVGFHGLTALAAALATAPVMISGYRNTSRRARRRIGQVALAVGGATVLMLAGGAVGVVAVADDLTRGADLIDSGVVAARDADDTEAAIRLGEASGHFKSASDTLTSWFVRPAHVLPVVGPNIRAVSELAEDSGDVTELSSAAATAADLDTLRFEEGRLDPERIERMVPLLAGVASSARSTDETVDRVRSPWLVEPVAEQIDDLEAELADNLPDLENAVEATRVAPALLGSEEPRRYLVLFTTPAEARGRTGFPGNFAELLLEDGKLTMPRFGRISELEQGGVPGDQRVISGPEDFLARYSRFRPEETWRNVVMSPDFPTIAQVAMELYPQSGGMPVDGVMSVTPAGLSGIMHFTGPVDVEGYGELTADNAEEFLHLEQYTTYQETSERADQLEHVARTTFERLTEASLPSPSEVIDVLDPLVDGDHIQFWTPYEDEESYFESIELTGRLEPVDDDFLAMTTANGGGSKIDAFLERTLRYEVGWDPDTGAVLAQVTATLRNNAPSSGLPDYVIGNNVGLPFGTNRSFVSIYSPWLLSGARINGQEVSMQSERELDRYVYSTFVDVPPGGEVSIELTLSGTSTDPSYSLALAPQPAVTPDQAEVTMTVVGDEPGEAVVTDGGEDVTADGTTVRWEGPLDRWQRMTVAVRDPDGS